MYVRKGWWKNLGWGVFPLAFVFLLVFSMVSWNEGRAVKVEDSLNEALSKAISVSPDKIDSANEGKLVHVVGMTVASQTIDDVEFGVAPKALALKRTVEMYQWDEICEETTETKPDGSRKVSNSYSFQRIWYDGFIDSRKFHEAGQHQNPPNSDFTPTSWARAAEGITLQAFSLRPELLQRVLVEEPLTFEQVPQAFARVARNCSPKVFPDGIFLGSDPGNPQIGDRRIIYTVTRPRNVSLVSMQAGSGFTPYKASNGCEVEILDLGNLSAQDLISRAHVSNWKFTWLIRVIGWVLLTLAFKGVLNVLFQCGFNFGVPAEVPGRVAKPMEGNPAGSLALFTVGLVWVLYRPFPFRMIVPVAVGILFLVFRQKAKKEGSPDGPTS